MMKIRYSSDEVRLKKDDFQTTHPDLYKKMEFEFSKVKRMNWDDFQFYKQEELAKSDNSKRVKYLGTGESYEFRIPPHSENGVLRALFTLDGDCSTIWITDVLYKSNQPKEAKNKTKRKEDKRGRNGKLKKGKAMQA
jgi:hypothetical protein